jgi:patatin-like phospholipase/acyl hydrolase
MTEVAAQAPYRVLSLEGGGAKGFYTLGVLKEVVGLVDRRCTETFAAGVIVLAISAAPSIACSSM